jgi:hypothetical protein
MLFQIGFLCRFASPLFAYAISYNIPSDVAEGNVPKGKA